MNCPRKDPQSFGRENSRGRSREESGEAKKLGGGVEGAIAKVAESPGNFVTMRDIWRQN